MVLPFQYLHQHCLLLMVLNWNLLFVLLYHDICGILFFLGCESLQHLNTVDLIYLINFSIFPLGSVLQ